MPAKKTIKQSELGFVEPWGVLLVGSTGSGKTEFLKRYLMGKTGGNDGITANPVKVINSIDMVYWVAPKASLVQTTLRDLSKHFGEFLEFIAYEDFSSETLDEKISKNHAAGLHTAVVFDDVMMKNNKHFQGYISDLCVHGRHRQVQPYILQQKIFNGDRVRRLQVKFMVLFNFAGKSEARMLFSQLAADKNDGRKLMDAYKAIVARPYGCMILDTTNRSTKDFPCAVRDTKLDRFIPVLYDAL